jgi:hypothetical protein
MRVENIADIHNSGGEIVYQHVDLVELASRLFYLVNEDSLVVAIDIEELSLSGNQNYESMSANRI